MEIRGQAYRSYKRALSNRVNMETKWLRATEINFKYDYQDYTCYDCGKELLVLVRTTDGDSCPIGIEDTLGIKCPNCGLHKIY